MARLINDRVALDLLLEQGPLTRPQLRELTGLAHPTVAQLVDRLSAAGLIRVIGERGEARRGPNALAYGVVADAAYVGGVEVRDGQVGAAVADITGSVLGSVTLPLDARREPADIVFAAVQAAAGHAVVPVDRLHSVVVGTPGTVDPATGDMGFSWDLPGWRANLLSSLRERVRRPVTLENEVNLAGVAERAEGVAAGRADFVLLSLGRGLGAAVILEGRLRRGASGGAGEIGLMPVPGAAVGRVRPGEPLREHFFQALAGGEAVLRIAARHGLTAPTPAEAVAKGLGDNDFLAEVGEAVAMGVASICAVIDPGLVVLAGTVGRAGGEALANAVADRLAEIAPLPVEVRPSTLGDDAVVRGAIITALSAARAAFWGEPR